MFELCKKVKTIMDKYGYPWFFVGECAFDLFMNKEIREHDKIEIGVFRKDQMKLYRYFEQNKKHYIDNTSRIGKKEKRIWNKEYLRLPVYEIEINSAVIQIRVLLNDIEENKWIYKINPKIWLDVSQVIQYSETRLPYLCPEILLLYKTEVMSQTDIEVFSQAMGKMKESQKEWFIDSIGNEEIREKIRNLTIAST